MSQAKPDMWDRVLQAFKDSLTNCESTYITKAKSEDAISFEKPETDVGNPGFNSTEEENEEALYIIRKRAWQALRKRIDEQTADAVMLTKLRNHFEERFRYDDAGVPRVWKPEDDIDGAFRKARDQVR